MSAARFQVHGRVQGVFFRQSTRQLAEQLGLSGWVRNRPDGSVEGAVHGAASTLEQLRSWLEHGPDRARVDRLDWNESVETDVPMPPGFSIR